MPCPDENALAELARDELPAAARAELQAHIDGCDACSAVVAELMRLFASSFAGMRVDAALDPSLDPSMSGLPSTLDGVEPPSDDVLPRELPLPEGAKLGRYVVLRVVGAGAMGIVYAAYDPELDRKVALKLLRLGPDARLEAEPAASASIRDKRLLREAQALARFAHPHVITVHDVGTWEGRVFLAMEFVDGGTLTRWLEAPRPWPDVLGVLRQAGEGLAAAHEAGLVHRDFKPDNVLLRADGRAVVTDFGLARSLVETPSEDGAHAAAASPSLGTSTSGSALAETLTRTGALVGTPAYMAPEQFDGQRGDARSDQFSFCVALYEGLHGERPFQGRTLGALMASIHAGKLAGAARGRDVPRWLRRAVLQGLRVQPQQRHASMHALLAALRPPRARRGMVAIAGLGAVAGAATVALWARPAPPDPAAYCDDVEGKLAGVWDEPARTELRAAFAATGLPFAESTAASVVAVLDDHAQRWARAQAEACRRGAEGREPAAVVDMRMTCLGQRRAALEATARALRRADEGVVTRAVDATSTLLDAAACLDGSTLGRAPAPVPEAERDQVESIRQRIADARALALLGKAAEARAAAEAIADEAATVTYGPLDAEVTLLLADALADAGAVAEAEAAMHRALAAGVTHDHDEVVAKAAAGLANLEQSRMGAPLVVERWASLGLAALASLGGSRPDVRASLLAARGHAQRRAGDVEAAITTLQEVLAIREQHWGPTHHSLAEPLTALGLAYAAMGRYDDSVRAIQQARAILLASYGEEHPHYAAALHNLATAHLVNGHYTEALAGYREAYRLAHAGQGPRHPTTGVLATNVALVLVYLERSDEALPFVRQAQSIEAELHGATSRLAASSWSLLAELHLRAGALAQAEDAARRGLAVLAQAAPDDRRMRANHESQLGHVLALAGRTAEADALLTATLAAQRELVGEPSVEVAETSGRLAMVRLAQGRVDEARALIEASVQQYEQEDPDPHQHAEAWFRRAQIRAAAGERAAARADAERARARYHALGDQPQRQRAVERWLAHP